MTPAEQCKDIAGKPVGHARPRGGADVRRAGVLAGVVRVATRRRVVPLQRQRGADVPPGNRRRATTTSTKYGKDSLHGLYLVPERPAVDDLRDHSDVRGRQAARASRKTRSSASAALTPQSGYTPYVQSIKCAQLDVRARRLRLREHRVPPQGSEGAGRQHREGVGLRAAVLRPAADQHRRLGRRGPVRVAVVPALRGQGPQRRARRVPEVRQEARGVRCAGVGRRADLRDRGERRSSRRAARTG